MSTWLITHPACLAHDTGEGHPESSARLEAVLNALDAPAFAALTRIQAQPAPTAAIERLHHPNYIAAIEAAVPVRGYAQLNADTVLSPRSNEAARCAAGAGLQAIDALHSGAARRVFCAVRPPGHHAEPNESLGFCLYNNAAITAFYAREQHGYQRIAVVDFDVHHGNGTQTMLEGQPGYLYISLHQHPLFPGTGTRADNRPGNIVNLPLAEGTQSADYRQQFHGEAIAELIDFDPDLIIISAGFDAAAADPLAGLLLSSDDFGWITDELVAVANYCCAGQICSLLEGGYDLDALAAGAACHVQALMR